MFRGLLILFVWAQVGFAAVGSERRLTQAEYQNAVRDLTGIECNLGAVLPPDEDTRADARRSELMPAVKQRYLDAARQVLDRAIVTPPQPKTFSASAFTAGDPPRALSAGTLGEGVDATVRLHTPTAGDYSVKVAAEAVAETPVEIEVKIDQHAVHRFEAPAGAPTPESMVVSLSPGEHTLTLRSVDGEARLTRVEILGQVTAPSPEKQAAHARLFREANGERTRAAAAAVVGAFAARAYGRPLRPRELDDLMAEFDRSAEQREPFELSVRLALEAVLVSPDFIFRTAAK